MKYEIFGQDFQVLNVWLVPGEKIMSEAGAMIYMSGNIKMEAKAKGGLTGILKRKLAGESAFLVEYTAVNGKGFVAFGKRLGKIVPIALNPEQSIIAQKDAFLASTPGVNIEIHFVKKIGAGLFGGEGFILQKLTAQALNQLVFLEACGEVIEMTLQPGQVLKVDIGNLVAFDPTIEYDIQRVGNIKTMLFGGEGLFVATLRGPGRVWIQSNNASDIAEMILPYVPK